MTHTVIGNVTNELYNTTVDKQLTFNRQLDAGTLIVGFNAGYSDGAPTLVRIPDSKSNTWDSEHILVADGSKWMAMVWAQVTNQIESGDTMTFNWSAPTPMRSHAIARAFDGLSADEVDVSSNYNGFSSNYPAAASPVSVDGDGRFIGYVFYPTEYDGGDFWENGIDQKVNYYSSTNVDMFSIGEVALSGPGSITPQNNLGFSSQWIIMGATFPEGSPAGGLDIRARILWF